MNITEILSTHVRPGAILVDLTPADAELSPHVRLPPHLGIAYRRTVEATSGPAAVAVVLHHLRTRAGDEAAPSALAFAVDGLADQVVHVVFVDDVRSVHEHGLADAAASGGLEITSVESTGHPSFPVALVLTRASADARRVDLRVINAWRLGKWTEREQARALERVSERLRKTTTRLDKAESQLEAARRELEQQRAELAQRRAAQDALVRAAKDSADLAGRATARLVSTRRTLSFRIARATRVALRDAARTPLALPARWLAVFRGADEVVDELRRDQAKPPRRRGG